MTYVYVCVRVWLFCFVSNQRKVPSRSQNHKWWLKWKVSLQTCPVEVVLNYMGAWELLRAVMNMASVLDATVDVLGLRWRYGVCHWTATTSSDSTTLTLALISSCIVAPGRYVLPWLWYWVEFPDEMKRICQLVIQVQSVMGRYGPNQEFCSIWSWRRHWPYFKQSISTSELQERACQCFLAGCIWIVQNMFITYWKICG